jgi:putative transposase
MDDDHGNGDSHVRWARLRFAIVGTLLAAPPRRGELKAALEALSEKQWRHPTTSELTTFGFSTVERWFYIARNESKDPVLVLRRRRRKDAGGTPSLVERVRLALVRQHQLYRTWSYQLHYDNLVVVAARDDLGKVPSYSTVVRYMKRHGLRKRPRLGPRGRPGVERAEQRLEDREVRSFEAEYVHGLFHADFHSGSLRVLTPAGEWAVPLLLGVLDDHSRLSCHGQWYLDENTENYVHGVGQAFQKRGLPRAFMEDNGGPMIAAETQGGFERLSIIAEQTLSNSPYQNGKQEVFWAQVEGRLLPMLERVKDLTLAQLNEATQAWLECEYNRKPHSETGEPPLSRFLAGKSVGRPSPSSEELRAAFTMAVTRTQRRSDGTVTVDGVRFEVPSRFRHLERVALRYARWDLSYLLLCDPQSDTVIGRLYPVDKVRNAEGRRRALGPVTPEMAAMPAASPASGMAPLMEKLLADYRATGLPPAYLPKDEIAPRPDDEEDSQ